jgi:hypothetical protein
VGARVYVKGVDLPFHVKESPAEVLEEARTCGLEGKTLPMAELELARPVGDESTLTVDPWSIVALTPWSEPGA